MLHGSDFHRYLNRFVLLDWLQEILEAATKLTQSLENREDQDAADLKAHALIKEIFLELLLVFLLGAKDSNIVLLI